MSCSIREDCSIYPEINDKPTLQLFLTFYCHHGSRFGTCERFVRHNKSQPVPDRMLPSGEELDPVEA